MRATIPAVTTRGTDPAPPGEIELERLRDLVERFPGMIYLEDADPSE